MDTILIDVGTSNLKMTRIDEEQTVQQEWKYAYRQSIHQQEHDEMNIQEIKQAIQRGFSMLGTMEQGSIMITTAMHSVCLLDDEFHPLTNVVTWADARGTSIVETETDRENLYLESGTPSHAMNPYYKLRYFKETPIWEQVRWIASLKDYLFFQLTGKWWIDEGNASSSGMYTMESRQWNPKALQTLGITATQLPLIYPSTACAPLTQNNRIQVYLGTSDGIASSLSYAQLSHTAVVSFGTSHAVRVITGKSHLNPKTQNFCYRIDDERYLIGFPSNNGGNVFEYMRQIFQLTQDELNQALMDAMNATPTGYFLPYVFGERAPLWNRTAKASLIGVTPDMGRQQWIHTMIWGVLMNVRMNVERLRAMMPFEQVAVTGGVMASESFCQALATTLQCPVFVAQELQLERLGTYALIHPEVKLSPKGKTYYPDQTMKEDVCHYATAFEQYIQPLMKEGMTDVDGIH